MRYDLRYKMYVMQTSVKLLWYELKHVIRTSEKHLWYIPKHVIRTLVKPIHNELKHVIVQWNWRNTTWNMLSFSETDVIRPETCYPDFSETRVIWTETCCYPESVNPMWYELKHIILQWNWCNTNWNVLSGLQ